MVDNKLLGIDAFVSVDVQINNIRPNLFEKRVSANHKRFTLWIVFGHLLSTKIASTVSQFFLIGVSLQKYLLRQNRTYKIVLWHASMTFVDIKKLKLKLLIKNELYDILNIFICPHSIRIIIQKNKRSTFMIYFHKSHKFHHQLQLFCANSYNNIFNLPSQHTPELTDVSKYFSTCQEF